MKFFRFIAVTVILTCLGAFSLQAQTRTVSGRVLDSGQQPLAGVAVIVEGTNNGTVTGGDGGFSLRVPSGDVTLLVSSLGYANQTVNVPASQAVVNITLEEDDMLLDETVVVGYGVQKKVNLTGAITQVNSKDLDNRITHNLTDMLQGTVPGLNISTSSGNPGSSGSINIRGTTSINSASPLVLVDGAEGILSQVNPNDIESISVIKDAAAAAIYGARAAYGVILITTKSGQSNEDGKAVIRYNGRFGWEQPTTSTDFISQGYWSVYITNLFWQADTGSNYINYNSDDMIQLLARVNDKTEDPSRPWTIIENVNGKDRYKYYANTDWYHSVFNDRHPSQQHSVSVSGGNKSIKYFLSGAYDNQTGILKQTPDVFRKYSMRSKIDAQVNKWMRISNNTSFYSSTYDYTGVNDVQDPFAYFNAHALACFPLQNPDGTWVYGTPYTSYKVGNGRHIVYGMSNNTNLEHRTNFANTVEVKITPVKQFTLTANYTYRLRNNSDTNRKTNMPYSQTPGVISYYTTGAGNNQLTESISKYVYHSANIFGNYDQTFADKHHVSAVLGFNYETQHRKSVTAYAENIIVDNLSDLDLVGVDATGATITNVAGGQTEYILAGYFGRLNYDYKGRYLFEASGRYDGTSRFAPGHRWGFFPSASVGWRISEEPFFAPLKKTINNFKLRASYGSLGNQNVSNYAYMRTISINDFSAFYFGDSSNNAKYSSLSSPNSSDLTWETSQQYNVGLDLAMFNNRLEATVEGYIRDTKNMLTSGIALPAVYGASSPKMNAADLRTKGYEVSLSWRNSKKVAGSDFTYSIKGTVSDFASYITKYDNPTKSFADSYYEGMRIGEIWGFEADKLFESDQEALEWTSKVDQSYVGSRRLTGGWKGGDLRYQDLDGDGKIGIGSNTVDDPGDRKILGNSLASLQYGLTLSADWKGFDFSIFFQGTGNHYWYPSSESMAFWGNYSRPYTSFLPVDYLDNIWSEDNTDAYFPRIRAYTALSSGAYLHYTNSRYLQNLRYLRLKNLTVGYSLPSNWTKKVAIDNVRIYFSGENLHYWSPFKEHSKIMDPEAAFTRSTSRYNNFFYPWQATYMFGIDITF